MWKSDVNLMQLSVAELRAIEGGTKAGAAARAAFVRDMNRIVRNAGMKSGSLNNTGSASTRHIIACLIGLWRIASVEDSPPAAPLDGTAEARIRPRTGDSSDGAVQSRRSFRIAITVYVSLTKRMTAMLQETDRQFTEMCEDDQKATCGGFFYALAYRYVRSRAIRYALRPTAPLSTAGKKVVDKLVSHWTGLLLTSHENARGPRGRGRFLFLVASRTFADPECRNRNPPQNSVKASWGEQAISA
jgi:hypothetical protein